VSSPEIDAPFDVPLRGGGRITLSAEGFRHPAAVSFLDDVFTPYTDVTHVSVSNRTVRIGTRRSVYLLNRSQFLSDLDVEQFVGRLARRVAASPGGVARIARMREIDRRAALAGPPHVTWAFLGVCLVGQILQLFVPGVEAAGTFSASLVRAGEVWRLVTANLLHAAPWMPVHFVLNGLGLLALGSLLEWTIGSARTALVMACTGIGAMAAGLIVDYEEALGASGVVMGVFGALVFLELRFGDELPAHWRLPRAVLWLGIGLQVALEVAAWAFLPIIASGAHLGGFLTGFGVAALVGRAGLYRERPAGWLRAANALALVVLVASIASAATAWVQGPDWSRRAEMLLGHEGVSPGALNDLAWLIATETDHDRHDLDVALRAAERAVAETGRREPNILDTLAEVHFQRGEREAALEVIEEAIRLDPDEPYYWGQRDRFLGRRGPDDRPDPPALPRLRPRRDDPSRPLVPGEPEVGV
jgi:membrane associated rhomboid family serine protease